jgi:hypothetical protein
LATVDELPYRGEPIVGGQCSAVSFDVVGDALDQQRHCRGAVIGAEQGCVCVVRSPRTGSLGNTVGDRDDVKSLLPLLLERLLTSTELDPGIVLEPGK